MARSAPALPRASTEPRDALSAALPAAPADQQRHGLLPTGAPGAPSTVAPAHIALLPVHGTGAECAQSNAAGNAFALTADTAVVVDGVYYFACPHCGVAVGVDAIACGIFRCGVLKPGTTPSSAVPPHADRATCDALVKDGKVWGCARPFRFDGRRATVCDYV